MMVSIKTLKMVKKSCKECPWVVKNSHNKRMVDFAKKHKKQHNCHMLPSDKRGFLWNVKEECMCAGSRKHIGGLL